MMILINLIEGAVICFIAFKGLQFITGKTNFSGEKEQKRIKVVNQYGWLIKGVVALGFIGGGILILSTLMML
jgi:hypothetical protein